MSELTADAEEGQGELTIAISRASWSIGNLGLIKCSMGDRVFTSRKGSSIPRAHASVLVGMMEFLSRI